MHISRPRTTCHAVSPSVAAASQDAAALGALFVGVDPDRFAGAAGGTQNGFAAAQGAALGLGAVPLGIQLDFGDRLIAAAFHKTTLTR
jgi:hypothetical protein